MRSILISLLLSLTFSSIAQVYDREELYLDSYDKSYIKKHKIKSMEYSVPGSIYNDGVTIYYFDPMGYITHVVKADGDSILSKEIYIRNEYRDLIIRKVERTTFSRSDTLFKIYEKEKLVREDNKMHHARFEYTYNDKGLLRSTTLKGLPGHFFGQIKKVGEFKYDQKDRLAEEKHTYFVNEADSHGIIVSHKLLVYDGEKLIYKKELGTYRNEYMHHGEGNVNYNYNTKGQLISITRSESSSDYFTYNKKGLISKVRTVFPAELNFTEVNDAISYTFYK